MATLLSFLLALIVVGFVVYGAYLLLGMVKGLHPNLRTLILLAIALFAVFIVFRQMGIYTF